MYNKYAEIEKKLKDATREQRAAYIEKLKAMKERNQNDYDNAVKFRPAYAPKGKETRDESGKRIVLAETTELLAHVEKFCATI